MADYGVPPYHETAAKAALRLLLSGAAGWGAVPPGANFGSAFLASGGRSAIAAQQASQAAERYALAQEEQKRRQDEDEVQKQMIMAQIEQMKKPPPEPKPEKPSAWVPQTRQEAEDWARFQASLKPAKEGEKPPRPTGKDKEILDRQRYLGETPGQAASKAFGLNKMSKEDQQLYDMIQAMNPMDKGEWQKLQKLLHSSDPVAKHAAEVRLQRFRRAETR